MALEFPAKDLIHTHKFVKYKSPVVANYVG